MVIGPDASIHSRAQSITLLLYSLDGGDVSISVDKPGLTPRVQSFVSPVDTKTAVVFDVTRSDEEYTVTATDDEGSDTCTITVEPQCTTGINLSDVEEEIKTCIEATEPTTFDAQRFEFQESLLEDIEQHSAEARRFNFPLQSCGVGEILGSRFGEYTLQVVYPDGPRGSDIDDLVSAVESYQWRNGVYDVLADSGGVQYFQGLKTSILTLRLYALYNATNE